jgi:hypothetical protein
MPIFLMAFFFLSRFFFFLNDLQLHFNGGFVIFYDFFFFFNFSFVLGIVKGWGSFAVLGLVDAWWPFAALLASSCPS